MNHITSCPEWPANQKRLSAGAATPGYVSPWRPPMDISLLCDKINWPISTITAIQTPGTTETPVKKVPPQIPPKPTGWNKQLFLQTKSLWQRIELTGERSVPDLTTSVQENRPRVHKSPSLGGLQSAGNLSRPFRALSRNLLTTELRLSQPLLHSSCLRRKQLIPRQFNLAQDSGVVPIAEFPLKTTANQVSESRQAEVKKTSNGIPYKAEKIFLPKGNGPLQFGQQKKLVITQQPSKLAPLAVQQHLFSIADGGDPEQLESVADPEAVKRYLSRTIFCIHLSPDPYGHCPICAERFIWCNTVVKLPCDHYFHPRCMHDWLTKSIECPDCGKPFIKKGNDSSESHPTRLKRLCGWWRS